MRTLLLLAAAASCRIPPGVVPDEPIGDLPPPALTALGWDCTADGASWELAAETASWTGGAVLWLTTDGRYVERHPVPSVSAAADGSTDRLAVALDVEPDWRLVVAGDSTAFACDDPPDGLLVVLDQAGNPADCGPVGPGLTWQGAPGVPACDDPFQGS